MWVLHEDVQCEFYRNKYMQYLYIYIYIYNFLHTYISAAQRHDLIHVIGILRGHLHPAGAHQIASACMRKTHVGR